MDDVKKYLMTMLNDLRDEDDPDEYEYEEAPEECPNGFKWCRAKQMCIPISGEGMDLDVKLPEIGGGVMESDLMKIIDFKIKNCADTNALKNEPIQDSPVMMKRIRKDVAGIGECADTNALKNFPDPKPAGMLKRLKKDIAGIEEMINLLREKGEYRAFFQQTLAKYGATSPRQLDPERRKQFFQSVNSAWRSKNEEKIDAGVHKKQVQNALGVNEVRHQLETILGNFMDSKGLKEEGDYSTYFKAMLNRFGVDSPEDLPEDKKKEFFDVVNSGWTSDEESVKEDMSDKMDPRRYADMRKRAAMGGAFTPKPKLDMFSSLADQKAQQRKPMGEAAEKNIYMTDRLKAAQDRYRKSTETFDPFYKETKTISSAPAKKMTPEERQKDIAQAAETQKRREALLRGQK